MYASGKFPKQSGIYFNVFKSAESPRQLIDKIIKIPGILRIHVQPDPYPKPRFECLFHVAEYGLIGVGIRLPVGFDPVIGFFRTVQCDLNSFYIPCLFAFSNGLTVQIVTVGRYG